MYVIHEYNQYYPIYVLTIPTHRIASNVLENLV